MKHLITLLTICLSYFSVFSQSVTARLVDKNTKSPIPYATIQTGEYSGVISNQEGYFTINLNDENLKSIDISCLGYQTKSMSIQDIKNLNYIIELEEAINQLNEVFLSNKTPNADEIIKQVNSNLNKNYKHDHQTLQFFHRNTAYADFNRFETEVTMATGMRNKEHDGVNKSLDSLTRAIVNSNTVYFQDYLGDLMIKNRKDAKLNVLKATSLVDKRNNFSLENVQTKAQDLILKYLDTTLTYKLKTGIIKVEDSMSLKSEHNHNKDNDPIYDVKNLKGETHGLLHAAQTYDDSFMKQIINPELYEYEFINVTSFNGELVYIIGFEPRKSKAKYAGKLYITDETFAVIKLDYDFGKGKRGEKFNLKLLLGIKYVENINKGTIIYQKTVDSTYAPKYINQEEGRYFYVNRPLKFIENSSEKNKVGFNFLIEGSMRSKKELFIINTSTLNAGDFTAFKEPEDVPYQKLNQYDPSIWKAYNAIEPLEEMKAFKAED
ncbi:carboxypeptidase-like regulatory domain-containing protein [Sabulilitoribacter multivorans]|uniref:Carboxypeptidase-like regulatory domain-containing protein n=1 Tax=Flaviramulus multivorans TaxID=1304750 RepID=A0ABS9II90_9FLAO|nr:carboxypeptidase-like regulatory domain-containing protein [Flaviramulus multivorans]MCF7560256.1 carboxypeptidase-like regulatory domain-containing protein [Flaviramulus multivorans]